MGFDREMKNLAEKIDIPESYDKRVDDILRTIEEKEENVKTGFAWKRLIWLAVCPLCIVCVILLSRQDVQADILTLFKETIMDFLWGDLQEDEKIGVESNKTYVQNKPDLMMELKEKVIDTHSIYLLVQMTASGNVTFADNVLFDYFCFCKGENYNVDQLLGGSRDCELLEVNEERPNVATYVVSITFDGELEEGSNVTVCFNDLTEDPYSDDPKLLIPGLWSLTFPIYRTVSDNIVIEGNSDMIFSYINTTAEVKNIELTPFGMVLQSDVSNFPDDERGVSDTTIAITLKMVDGSELVVVSHDPDVRGYIQGGSISFSEVDGKTWQQDNLEFTNMINIEKVCGIYIEELYVPVIEWQDAE